MRTIITVGLSLVLLVLLVGCGPTDGVEGREADIRGTITDLSSPGSEGIREGVVGAVLIEGEVEEDTTFDKAFVTITEETGIYRQEGGRLREASFADLAIGQRVQARFTGPVAESYPVQATADEIVILEPAGVPAPGEGESPLPEPGASPISPQTPLPPAVSAAVEHLAGELSVSPQEVTVVSFEAVQWPDASLGCPQAGMAYAQVVTPGYLVLLEVGGRQVEVHTDETGRSVVSCPASASHAPTDAGDAFQVLLTYLIQEYPGFGLDQQGEWSQEDVTPEGLVGASTRIWRSGEWSLQISYPVVPQPAYQAVLEHARAGVVWAGRLEPDGQVTPAGEPVVLTAGIGPCDESVSLEELDEWAGVEIGLEGGTVHIRQRLSYVCCAELALAVGREGTTIKVIETNVGEVCRCMCGYQVTATLAGLSPGTYTVEVWGVQHFDVHPLELLGSASVMVP